MEIRQFEERDRHGLISLMDDFGGELAAMDPLGRVVRADGMGRHAVARMLRRARANEGKVMVACRNDEIIGFASGEIYRRDRDERYEVVDYVNREVSELYVEPGSRRTGVGRALLTALEDYFREHGCGAVAIEVFAPNAAARRFYASLGYEERDLFVYRMLTS